jgi:carbonic anhydrase
VHAAVEANVHWSIKQLLALPEGRRVIEHKAAMIIGSVYDIATGKIRFLE